MRLGLLSNSTDDVSYYEEISDLLEARGKQNMIVSNAVQSFTEKLAQQRKADMLFGMEGMSERLRWIVNKPIARSLMRDKVALCLRNSGQVKLIYQFNLPGEEARDFWRARNGCIDTTVPTIPEVHAAAEATPESHSCAVYQGCEDGLPVHWCEHSEGGYDDSTHGWPLFGGQMIWDFVQSLP